MKIPKKAVAILAIYAIVILGSIIYFCYMQRFGSNGLQFYVGGEDNAFGIFDALIIALLPVALVLFIVSVIAFKRKPELRLFLISTAFFFFVVKEALYLIDNFFPKEFIFIDNAVRALEFLILLSFVFLMYRK